MQLSNYRQNLKLGNPWKKQDHRYSKKKTISQIQQVEVVMCIGFKKNLAHL